jgi:sec-independent protein translocase protein TatA
MGGLSLMHWLIILVIVLLFMGPNKLPQLGRSLGEAIRGFKKGLNDDEIDVTNASRREQLRDNHAPSDQHQTESEKDKNKV